MVEIKKFLKEIGGDALLELYCTVLKLRKNEDYDEAAAMAALAKHIENTGVKQVLSEFKLDELQIIAKGFKVDIKDSSSRKGGYAKRIYEHVTGDVHAEQLVIKEKKETDGKDDKKEEKVKGKEEKGKKGKATKGKAKEEEKKEKSEKAASKMVTRDRAVEEKHEMKDVPALAEQIVLLNAEALDLFVEVLGVEKGNHSHKHVAGLVAQAIHGTGLSCTLGEVNITFLKDVCDKLKINVEGETSRSILINSIVDGESPTKKPVQKKKIEVSKQKPELSGTITEEDIHQYYFLEELQQFCRDKGIAVSGKKKEVGKRIVDYFNEKLVISDKKEEKKADKKEEKKADKKEEKKADKKEEKKADKKEEKKEEKKTEKKGKKAKEEEKKEAEKKEAEKKEAEKKEAEKKEEEEEKKEKKRGATGSPAKAKPAKRAKKGSA